MSWQHAQLFRQPFGDKTDMLNFTVEFAKEPKRSDTVSKLLSKPVKSQRTVKELERWLKNLQDEFINFELQAAYQTEALEEQIAELREQIGKSIN